MRALLTDKRLPAAQLAAYGDQYAAAGHLNVAVMFYDRAKSKEGLGRVRAAAMKAGDEFLLAAVAKADPALVSTDDWRTCAEAALAKQQFVFARDAFRRAGDEGRAVAAQAEFLKVFPG